jgi:hypothetical protein
MDIEEDTLKSHVAQLGEFIIRQSVDYSYNKTDPFAFNLLVRASIIKCYEFLKFVFLSDTEPPYFIGTSYLRSIIEEIIVLKSVQAVEPIMREKLLRSIQELEVNNRILVQWAFFQRYRPFQPVISRANHIDSATAEIQRIWQQSGWPNFKVSSKNVMPPVRQLAEKLAPGILDILYDFIYRLTSSDVHFSIQSLFRMSWGEIRGDEFKGGISVNNMSHYYETYCKIYGPLLFSFYFEFFEDELGATHVEQTVIQAIRKHLIEKVRWPELIAFEEMNLPVPKAYHDQPLPNMAVHKYFVEILKDGFINKEFEAFLNQIKL